MRQAGGLLAICLAVIHMLAMVAGPAAVLSLVLGGLSMMALAISATFLWLWMERTTPLALGMAYSWAGTGLALGQLWLARLAGAAPVMPAPLLMADLLALSLVGAVLHFAVIHRSRGGHGPGFLWPVGCALLIAGIAHLAA